MILHAFFWMIGLLVRVIQSGSGSGSSFCEAMQAHFRRSLIYLILDGFKETLLRMLLI